MPREIPYRGRHRTVLPLQPPVPVRTCRIHYGLIVCPCTASHLTQPTPPEARRG